MKNENPDIIIISECQGKELSNPERHTTVPLITATKVVTRAAQYIKKNILIAIIMAAISKSNDGLQYYRQVVLL